MDVFLGLKLANISAVSFLYMQHLQQPPIKGKPPLYCLWKAIIFKLECYKRFGWEKIRIVTESWSQVLRRKIVIHILARIAQA